MHFPGLVLVPGKTKIEDEIAVLIAPYEDHEDEDGNYVAGWDWWMIGGRATGMLDCRYDPDKDPANVGQWPTRWVKFPGDIQKVSSIALDLVQFWPLVVVTPDGKWHKREDASGGWNATPAERERWARQVTAMLADNPNATAVVVDFHD